MRTPHGLTTRRKLPVIVLIVIVRFVQVVIVDQTDRGHKVKRFVTRHRVEFIEDIRHEGQQNQHGQPPDQRYLPPAQHLGR